MRAPRWLAVLAGLGLCCCATLRTPAFEPHSSRTATVEWRRDAASAVVPVTFETGAENGIRLIVGGDKPLLALTRVGGEWAGTGPLAGHSWRGTETASPPAVAGWLCVAEAWEGAAFTPVGESDVRTGRFSVRYEKSGGTLRRFELVVVATGERFRVTF